MDFPRPSPDTGIAVHGCSDCGWKPADFQWMIAQFKERGIYSKLLFCCDEGKVDWAKALVDAGIMPILRLWPTFAPKLQFDIAHAEAYRDVGVKWIVVGNEPNLDYEWGDSVFPGGAPRKAAYAVAEGYAHRADVLRQRGMWPMTPPPSLGGNIKHRDFFRYFMERIAQLGNPLDILYPGGIGLHCRCCGNPLEARYTWYDCSADEWRWFDKIVNEYCGQSLPMANTEAFTEPDWLPKLYDGKYDWDLWRSRNLRQFKWFKPGNEDYEYPDYMLCNAFWLLKSTGFLQAWDEDGLFDNNAYDRQTGRSLVTHLWESMKGYVNWDRGDEVIPPEPPTPPTPPEPVNPVGDIEFDGLSEEMIERLSVTGPDDETKDYWKIVRVEVQPETDNMSAWVIVAAQPTPPVLFWADEEAPMNWKAKDDLAPLGAREGGYEQPMHHAWGSYGVRMPGNSESLHGIGLYGPNLELDMTAHRPVLIWYRYVEAPEPPEPQPPSPTPYKFLNALNERLEAAALPLAVDERTEIEDRYADLDKVGKRGLGPADLWSQTWHHTASTEPLSVLSIAEYHTQTKGWPHIAYHFVIGKAGRIYFCKKLGHYSAQCGYGRVNRYGIAVAVHGDFTKEEPTEAQLKALKALTESLEEFVGGDYGKRHPLPIIRHYDLVNTECPGGLYEAYQEWLVN